MPYDDPPQPPPGNVREPPSEPRPTGGVGPPSGESLSEIFGLDPVGPERDPLIGVELGGVKIIRLIAQGGMGRVYEGLQQKPSRTVAVKVVRPGLATPEMMKRFEYEAEVLGRLRHPGIAQIFSAGVHRVAGTPVPYFIMELVADAKPLTAYAADLKLTTRERLCLFRSVCEAIAHGHQRGIIHRDLKPSNILVDATGQPKVIDFGVAKATGSEHGLTMQVGVSQLLGTLPYMGPEQIIGESHDADVRSDVYSLGVVMYELLTGRLPHDLRRKSLFEAQRIVKEERPASITSLDRTLDSAVAAISAKCLEKDHSRRYWSAGELAAEIDRHLQGLPVMARPEPTWEAVRRLCKRHRAWVTAGGVAIVSLVGALGIVAYYYRVAVDERELANEKRREVAIAREQLEQRWQDSEVVIDFLGDAMQLPALSMEGGATTLEQWLHVAAEAAKNRFANSDSPRDMTTRGRLLTKIGMTLSGLGYPTDGRKLLMEADEALRAVTKTPPQVRVQCLNELSLACWECGDYKAAADASEEAHRVTMGAESSQDQTAAMMLHGLALARMGQGKLVEADKLFAEVFAAVSNEFGPANARTGIVLTNWGDTLRRQGRLEDAEVKLRNAVDILDTTDEGHELALASALNNLGEVYRAHGRSDEALLLHERARDIQESLLGPHHYGRATSLSKLGEVRRVRGDLALANSLCRQALALRERAGLGGHPETAVIYLRLARIAAAQGNVDDAIDLYTRCEEIRERSLGADHDDTRSVHDEQEDFKEKMKSPRAAVAGCEASSENMP